MQIYNGSLDVQSITNEWYERFKDKNCGALITFVGIVREEGGISALSFDIYEPILKKWLDAWQERAKKENAYVLLLLRRRRLGFLYSLKFRSFLLTFKFLNKYI